MNLWQNLHSECISTQVSASNKQEVLATIARTSSQAKQLAEIGTESILEALTARERLGSTGLSDGIAIPHCSFEGLDEFIVGVVTTAKPIAFDALDERPSQIFIFLIGPTGDRNKHVRLLSSISKAVKDASVRRQLIEAQQPQTIQSIFERHIAYSEPGFNAQGKSQITICIQHEEYFNDILEAVSAETDGSLSVIETENANQYLYRMPLFAGFWNDQRRGFSRMIIAVVNRESVNSVLRRVNTIAPDLEQNSGVMITVSELSFSLGSIDF